MRFGWWIILIAIAPAAFAREPWTTSRVTGSPDPPPPYITERVFSKLKFREPLELTAMPGTDRFVLVEHEGKVFSFPNKEDCEKADLFANIKDLDPEIRETYSI